jgi:hypothetical protein
MSMLHKVLAATLSACTVGGIVGALPAHADDPIPASGGEAQAGYYMDPTADDGAMTRSAPPASVDLRAYAMPVANQGAVNSCVTWSIDYALMGWYAKKLGIPGVPLAPMYTYSQLVGGRNVGTRPIDVLTMGMNQGVDAAAHYTQGAYSNYTTLPTAAEKLNAKHWRIRSFRQLFYSDTGNVSTAGSIIKSQLAAGRPVSILMRERTGLFKLADDPAVDTDTTSASPGNHDVLALGYNSAGVLVQNSWGTNGAWNANNRTGYGRISWNVLNHDVLEADTISGLVDVADHSLDNDLNNDILARTGSGDLYFYSGTGHSGFGSPQLLSSGFNDYKDILVTKDVNGDGHNDIVVRDIWNSVWILFGDETGGWSGYKQVAISGVDFSTYQRLLAPGDFNSDGRADLMGIKTDGTLNLFTGNGVGGFAAPLVIGHGWAGLTGVYTPGDFNGDRTADLIGRHTDGTLWLYPGNGATAFHTAYQIGTGWNGLRVTAPGDLTGDAKSDLLVVTSAGALLIYPGNGTGKFSPSFVVASSGWNVVNYLG